MSLNGKFTNNSSNESPYQRRKRMGKCVRCGRPPVSGKTMCQKHIDEVALRRSTRINSALCTYCGRQCSVGKTICTICTQVRAEQRECKKLLGLCAFAGCLNNARVGKVSCLEHADRISDRTRELKQIVLDHYGQRCNCSCGCSVTKFEHLTIDHKNNDGASQRKDGRYRGGNATYRYAINAKFPDDLQILCWNCNCAKQYYGGCK